MLFCGLLIFIKSTLKKILSGIPSESYRLDPDQAQCFVRPDIGPNCLLFAKVISRQYLEIKS